VALFLKARLGGASGIGAELVANVDRCARSRLAPARHYTRCIRINIAVALMLLSAAASAVSGQGQAGIPVLIYHEIGNASKELGETAISLDSFTQQMRYLADRGYTTISVRELVNHMRRGDAVPQRPVVLTFDDGWKSVLNAIPVLDQYGFKASFWIVAEKGIGGDCLAWDDLRQIIRNPRFEVGSHTLTHPWNALDNLVTWTDGTHSTKGRNDARRELLRSRQLIEEQLQVPVRYLAWPVGWYNARLIGLAKRAGYQALLTAEDGLNRYGDDVFAIKRIFVDGACDLEAFARSLEQGRYVSCQIARPPTRGHLPRAEK